MPLLNSGETLARLQLTTLGYAPKDENGALDQAALDEAAKQMGKMYNQLFKYLCDTLTEATIHTPGAVTGAAVAPVGSYSGATTGKVQIKIT